MKTIMFKVEFPWKKPLSRVIELREDQTLDDLHLAIQGAFGWDDDHPYIFSLAQRSKRFRNPEAEYLDPRVESFSGQHSAAAATLGSLGLRARRTFRYLFDFGDNLLHTVTVLGAGEVEAGVEYPRLLEKQGQNAHQYAPWS